MIKRSETELSEADYAAFVDAFGEPRSYKVVAHKSNLDFNEVLTDTTVIANDDKDFTIAHSGEYVYRLSGEVLEQFDLTSETWTTISAFTMPSDSLVTPGVIIVDPENSSLISVYVPTVYGLKVASTTNGGTSWSSWTNFYAGNQFQTLYSSNLVIGGSANMTANASSGSYPPNNVRTDVVPGGTDMWLSADYAIIGNWIQATFTTAKRITKYSIKGRNSPFTDQNPVSWVLERHNGTTWVAMHTVTDATWLPSETKTFILSTLSEGVPVYTPSTLWRIRIVQNGGNTVVVAIHEIQMFETLNGAAVPDVVRVSSPSPDRIHMVYKDQPKQLYNLRVAQKTGDSWAVNVSDIWWTFDMGDFSAVSMPDEDVIVITSEVPGTLTVLSQGNQPVKHVYTMGGLIAFKYKYGTWSDHIPIEIVDNVESWRYRDNSRATVINGLLVATCYSSDGTAEYPLEGYRYYTSRDGKFWSNGNLMPMPEADSDSGFGLSLVTHGDYIYGFERQRVYKSYSSLSLGHSPESQQIDITDFIEEYSLSHDGAFQAGMILQNATGWLDTHPIVSTDNTVTFVHYAGYWFPDEENPGEFRQVLIQIGVSQMDNMDDDRQLPEKVKRVTSRDHLQYFTDLVGSEQARYYKSQIIGSNNFTDTGDSSYGGLSHTATQSGAFITLQSWLEIDVSMAEAIGFSTFITDLWNGSVELRFRMIAGAGQYAGIIFRAIDPENMWYTAYETATNKLKLVERRVGIDYTRTIMGSSLGWAVNTDHWIRVEMRYAQIKIYYSNDGRVWTLALEYLMSAEIRTYGEPYLKRIADVPMERGYTGQIGKGFK
jgi:hypothetical protein